MKRRAFLKKITTGFLGTSAALAFGGFSCIKNSTSKKRPNFVIIMADDLGYGDVSINGGDVNTPNIDKLAKEGLLFTDFHSNGAVCSPTRAALLTGRYQQRMGIISALGEGEKGLGSPQARTEVTIAQYLKKAGYFTGIVGKWHLGYNEEENPIHFGFDEFRGMLHGAVDYHSHINTFGRFDWWHNKNLVREEGYATDLITDHAEKLIEFWKEKPFFLFVSHLAIHFPWQTPDDDAHREEGKKYREVSGPLNRLGPHPPEESGATVRVMNKELDKSVGKILTRIKNAGIDKNTLVLFLSDNGGIVQYRGGYTEISSNKPLRGAKGQLYEGGHRVPAVAWWPDKIKAGNVTGQVAMTMDILPTVLNMAGIDLTKEETVNKIDGIDISSLLLEGKSLPARKLFWHTGKEMAIRSSDWKLILSNQNDTVQLYDLKTDIGEKNNLADENPQITKELLKELNIWKQQVMQKD